MSEQTELGKLIEAASRANHKRSMQEAADLATSRGAPISKSLISESARRVETITPKVIRGIAAGYDIPEEDVARAMLADLGIAIVDYNPGVESAIRRDPDLSAEARGILLAAITAARSDLVSDQSKKLPRGGRIIHENAPSKDTGVRRGQQSG
ncbi:hypothetical protein [Mycobacterium canetti]|uniref:hypothetical protein n=1 Tax=Mycobacterium canetti TaxID=78331 RepID=UPI000349EA63|nr:hypothetical protein [Mycobacterium canetti]